MRRQLLQRYLPDPERLRRYRSLRFVHPLIDKRALWQVSRHTIANAVSVGLFCALLPIPCQMLVAALGAWIMRANLPLSIALVWLTNPLTMPVVFYTTYRVGAWVLQRPIMQLPDQLSVQWFATQLTDAMPSLILGSLICAMVIGALANILTRLIWRWQITRLWRRRRHRSSRH
ncbi:hypothetical protein C7446_1310 [Kushneria sinocarnis]|uniref:DUF2062 domain-containing protein n=1 Tax=Kushneria sinocarnis TaxID=595502 RepID=A0A420WYV9_9GAMM|nr:DUF2062 domain-containing protein [Kushneria sinocarnis]RKR06368.1 hypothetical protein C7446_1310 [Kushneria sinocarnis]